MKKPTIGVMPLIDSEKESYWMLPGYMEGIIEAGGIPVMLPLTADEDMMERLVSMCDGFLLTGGQDVSPELYGGEKLESCGETCMLRDKMEMLLLKKAIRDDKAVFGICRGIQFMNAALGGTLYQDLPSQKPSEVEHHQTPPYDRSVHQVMIVENTPLHGLLKKKVLDVNSYHHQAVKELAESLQAMAYSTDGLVEAVYMPGKKFIQAVQWHPEFSYKVSEDSRKIFQEFVRCCVL